MEPRLRSAGTVTTLQYFLFNELVADPDTGSIMHNPSESKMAAKAVYKEHGLTSNETIGSFGGQADGARRRNTTVHFSRTTEASYSYNPSGFRVALTS
jgi:hypothetical protein